MFWILGIFFAASAALYIVWNIIVYGHPEPVGTVALILSTVLGLFLAFYLQRSFNAQGGDLPEDRVDANVDDGDPEIGHFAPWSWWPVLLGASAAIVMVGLAIGFWICFIGVGLALICLIGWVFEFYRGYFAR
jgi:Cytochrome c oxidase subunit IV